jgi:NAD(P)-dependent dehydrogenase (short-subunit alcohol dehydrogenase family)
MCVVHGNTLTAAVVLEHIKRLLNMRKASPRSLSTSTDVILTGATSKIGRAIALKLAAMNVRTLCIGTDSTRMRDVLAECDAVSRSLAELSAPKKSKKRQVVLPQAAVVQFATIADASERAPDAIWVIGKYDSPKVP